MDRAALAAILDRLCSASEETGTVEFKSNWDNPHDIGEYICALGNTARLDNEDRAWLLWGVENGTHRITGTVFDPFSAKGEGNQSLIMWLMQKISPKPDFQFHRLEHADGPVIMLEIHPPRMAPLAFQGERFIRVDSHKTKLAKYPAIEGRLWAALESPEDWSSQIIPGATFDDLDPDAVSFCRQRFLDHLLKGETDPERQEKIRTDAHGWDITTLLNKARLTIQGRITRSTLLLLGRDESAHFLSPADVKISWILRDDQHRMISSQHFGMPLLLATDAVFRRIRNVPIEYMPDGSLFPVPIPQYDNWVIREALHNCIAHQDYRLGGKINVVEYPDKLVFSNLGSFIPQSVEWMLENQSPPERYRNQWLIDGMIRLRMIDQAGSGIRRMYETQRERYFPLPDYDFAEEIDGYPRVRLSLSGKILDSNYTQLLMRRADLKLRQVFLLDKVQKGLSISANEARALREGKLIEGRAPNYFISAKVAEWTDQKARYIHNRAFDDEHYRKMIIEYLRQYKQASRQELDELLLPKLSDVLTFKQKRDKIRNLLQALRREGHLQNLGGRQSSVWALASEV
ncbi:RNA-binding domain-containing protein [Desulfomicrobium baculatum]|uniref:Putative transcriptional regulator n=1 Tax=Desulfomicrobium baculatum (strain DSM 4028 / VKM B-1378 / X) TaxID=525897 RepID=C7LSL0_DESBD|nr:RNA-binding domain-containing protein [Desulfomicrobium baculatum]ACU88224.1 putative transcriptional regulator [Desulfomicrobium baculatum DSM 4028]